jgi:hypothetical protein
MPSISRTIPSRIETKLDRAVVHKEPGGVFGVQEPRFHAPANLLPGPGTYGAVREAVTVTPSHSMKGLGNGFVSKTARSSLVGPAKFVPGPGAYDVVGAAGAAPAVGKAVPGGSTFGRDGSKRSTYGSLDEGLPGPGFYDVSAGSAGGSADTHVMSSFASSSKREVVARGTAEIPGPGAYDVGTLGSIGPGKSSAPTAAFRKPVTVEPVRPEPAAIYARMTGIMGQGLGAEASAGPGPGAYDVLHQATSANHHLPRKPRPFTGIRDVPSRPAKPAEIKDWTPGPGAYEPPPGMGHQGAKEKTSSSAIFKSTIKRIKRAPAQPAEPPRHPGPALYKPVRPGKKSFHLNASGSWV